MKALKDDSNNLVIDEVEELLEKIKDKKISGVFFLAVNTYGSTTEIIVSQHPYALLGYIDIAKLRYEQTIIEKENLLRNAMSGLDAN